MKKYLLTTAALIAGFAGTAYADDAVTVNGVTIYGTVDVGLTYDTHGAPPNGYYPPGSQYSVGSPSNKPVFAVAPGGLGNSRIGIKGIEDLGGGFSGLFKLETGFSPTSGNLSSGAESIAQQNGVAQAQRSANGDSSREGQAFNQQAWVGVTNAKFGTLTLGRQNSLQLDAIGAYDPMNSSYAFSLVGYTGVSGGGAGDTQDARWDNSVKYMGSFGPIRFGAMYAPGGTVTRDDAGYAADIGGDYAGFSVDGVYTHKKDQINVGQLSAAQVLVEPTNSLTATVSDNTDYSIQGKYKSERWSVSAGYQYIVFANPSSPVSAGSTGLGGFDLSVVNNTAFPNHKILQVTFVGGRYMVTDKIDVGVGFYHYDQNGYRAASAGGGCSTSIAATCSGQQNNASFDVIYHATKRFDLYAGAMYSQVVDGLANGFLHNNNIDPTAGMRFIF